MNFLKSLWDKLTSLAGLWSWISSSVRIIASFSPELMKDPEALRLWIATRADDLLPLVRKTETTLDDKIVDWIKKIALNEKAFTAVYQLLLLVWGLVPEPINKDGETLFGTSDVFGVQQDVVDALLDGDEAKPQDAMSILMAVSILVEIISRIREIKKRRNEL